MVFSLTLPLLVHVLVILLLAQFLDFLNVPLNLAEVNLVILLVFLQIVGAFNVSQDEGGDLFECEVGVTREGENLVGRSLMDDYKHIRLASPDDLLGFAE